MDDFKRNTIKNYTAWDIDCSYNSRNWNTRNKKLKNIFRRKARRNLKRDIKTEE